MDACGADAVCADAFVDVVASDGESHGEDSAFGHGVCEAVLDADFGRDRCKVENRAAAVLFHFGDGEVKAVVDAFYVYVVDFVEFVGCGIFDVPDGSDASVVD